MKSNIRSGIKPPGNRFIYTGLPFFLLCATIFGSCSTNKNITYFQNVPDSIYRISTIVTASTFTDPLIQPNDILQVSILTLDPAANNVLTSANSSSFSVQPLISGLSGTPPPTAGFLVDKNGFIELPVTGKIRVSGLSTSDARDLIHHSVSRFYKDPVVNVRFTNFSVTVLGEVARPAAYIVPNEKVSVLDAIGMAGDLTIYGKRENVLLVRDSSGQKIFVRFNLNSSQTFTSPYFYLKQGDMVYVEPNKSKIASTDAVKNRNFTIAASGLSVMIILLSRIL